MLSISNANPVQAKKDDLGLGDPGDCKVCFGSPIRYNLSLKLRQLRHHKQCNDYT